MDVNHFTASTVFSYEGDSFVQSDENYTWKATKKGEHTQSDYNTGTGTGTVSTGLTGVTGVKSQGCYYSDIESTVTGGGEIPTLGLAPFTINANSAYGTLYFTMQIFGVPITDTDLTRDLMYFTTRDGVSFAVDTQKGRVAYSADTNYKGSGGAIRTGGVWYDTSGIHDMGSRHGVTPAISFQPYDFLFIFREPGIYSASTTFNNADSPTAPFSSDVEVRFVNAQTGEILGGSQRHRSGTLGQFFASEFMTVFYISEPDTHVKITLKFVSMSTTGDFTISTVMQKLQTKDSNPINTIV